MNIKLMVDSSSTMTREEAKKHNIFLLPLHVITPDQKSFLDIPENYDKYNIAEELLANKIYRTSQNNQSELEKAYDECLQNNDLVVFFPCSPLLSGQYKSAAQVAAHDKYKNKIIVIDNKLPGPMTRLIVIKLSEMVQNGADYTTIMDFYNKSLKDFVCAVIPGNNRTMVNSGRFKKLFSSFLDVAGLKVMILWNERAGINNIGRTIKGMTKNLVSIIQKFLENAGPDKKYNLLILSNKNHGAKRVLQAEAILKDNKIKFEEEELMGTYSIHGGLEIIGFILYPTKLLVSIANNR